jgi:hypothetical protein
MATVPTVNTLDEDTLGQWKNGARTQNQVTPRGSTAPVLKGMDVLLWGDHQLQV